MTTSVSLLLAFVVGMALGAVSLCGLWWTLRKLPHSRRPVALLTSSYLVRTAIVVTGLVLVMDGRWERIAVALLGYLLLRGVLVRVYGWSPERQAAA